MVEQIGQFSGPWLTGSVGVPHRFFVFCVDRARVQAGIQGLLTEGQSRGQEAGVSPPAQRPLPHVSV